MVLNIYDQIARILGDDILPLRDCNFLLFREEDTSEPLMVKSLTLPDSGIDFTYDATMMSLPIPSIKMNALSVEAWLLKPFNSANPDWINKMYYSQFKNGLLSVQAGINISIKAVVPTESQDAVLYNIGGTAKSIPSSGDSVQNLLTLQGCYCSTPKYSASPSSNNIATVSTNIYYRSYKVEWPITALNDSSNVSTTSV